MVRRLDGVAFSCGHCSRVLPSARGGTKLRQGRERRLPTCVVIRSRSPTQLRSMNPATTVLPPPTLPPTEVVGPASPTEDDRAKEHVDRRETLTSQFIVVFADYLSDLIVLDIIDRIETRSDMILVAAGTVAAYIFADLTSGLYYWLTHSYGSSSNPFWGVEIERARRVQSSGRGSSRQRAETRGSHHRGSDVEDGFRDDFFKTVVNHCLVAIPFLTVIAGWQPDNLALETFSVMFVSCFAILPQLHRWSRMEYPPVPVQVLQHARLLGRKRSFLGSSAQVVQYNRGGGGSELGAMPDGNYCLGNTWNHVLDSGRVFRRLERFMYIASNGWLIPRAWRDDPAETPSIESTSNVL